MVIDSRSFLYIRNLHGILTNFTIIGYYINFFPCSQYGYIQAAQARPNNANRANGASGTNGVPGTIGTSGKDGAGIGHHHKLSVWDIVVHPNTSMVNNHLEWLNW